MRFLRVNPSCCGLGSSFSYVRWAAHQLLTVDKEDMDECEEAIVDYCLEANSGLATSIWFCGFAQYQAGDNAKPIHIYRP